MHSDTEMEDFAYRGKLFDFYGELLSPRQKEIYEMNVERDMSLSEIAEVVGISRQGVHSALQKTDAELREYEEKLGLIARFERLKEKLSQAKELIAEIEEEL